MRHKLFWDVLSKKQQNAEATQYVEAGLRVMRHIDVYLESGPEGARLATNVRNLSRQLEVCGGTPLGALLQEIVFMVDRPCCSLDSIIGLLSAYGRLLELTEDWVLAYDVWEVVVDAIDTIGLPAGLHCGDPLVYAMQCYARVARRKGDYELSLAKYARALELADKHGLPNLRIIASLGDAATRLEMGDVHRALEIVNAQLDETASGQWPDLHAKSLHARGNVYYQLGRYRDALENFERALQVDPNSLSIEPLVGNIAACAAKCGRFDIAMDAHRFLSVHAAQAFVRMTCVVNLIELATWMSRREDFDVAAAQAETFVLDHRSDGYRKLYVVRGRIHFALTTNGVEELHALRDWASQHDVVGVVNEINADLDRYAAGGSLLPPRPANAAAPTSFLTLRRFLRRADN